MKTNKLQLTIALCLLNSLVMADNLSDSNTIFNWGEENYPQFLSPKNSPTLTFDDWIYRYYSETQNYVGTTKGELYLLGKATNDELVKLGSVNQFIAKINPPITSTKTIDQVVSVGNTADCKQIPYRGVIGKTVMDKNIYPGVDLFTTILESTDGFIKQQENTFQNGRLSPPTITSVHYEIKTINGQPFRFVSNLRQDTNGESINASLDDSHSPAYIDFPVNWCAGMKWIIDDSKRTITETEIYNGDLITTIYSGPTNQQTVTENGKTTTYNYIPDQEEFTIVSVNDSVQLLDGTTRSAIQLTDKYIRTEDSEPESYIYWLDIETGYAIRQQTFDANGVLQDDLIAFSIN